MLILLSFLFIISSGFTGGVPLNETGTQIGNVYRIMNQSELFFISVYRYMILLLFIFYPKDLISRHVRFTMV